MQPVATTACKRRVAHVCLCLAGLAVLMLPLVAPAAARGPGRLLLAQAETKVGHPDKKTIKTMDGREIDIEEARKLFKQHQEKLKEVQRERKSLEARTKTLDSQRARLQTRLLKAAKKAQEVDKRLNKIESDLAKLSAREAPLRKALTESRRTIARKLGIMQRMGREPPPIMITERNDALKMVRSAIVLSSFFPGFKTQADKLSAQVSHLDDIIQQSRKKKRKLASVQADAGRTRAKVEELLAEKRERLQKNWSRLENVKTAATRHSRAVTSLGGLLKRLDGAAATKLTGMAAYEEELKQLSPTYVLKPEAKKVAFVQPGRMKPAVPFAKARGLLPMPCQGKRLVAFGGQNNTGVKSEGIRIETLSGSQVISPSDGWVIYAGQFRSYGQLLIINAGGGYHILLAGMDRIHASVGQFVLAGEPVAAMGKAKPLSESSKELRRPILYIEFRKGARPIDPNPWWSDGDVKKG
ncbi:MAG: peptidoglycan DD-metalloendopeptidase family protein [Alphaproteobacteria bacterium]